MNPLDRLLHSRVDRARRDQERRLTNLHLAQRSIDDFVSSGEKRLEELSSLAQRAKQQGSERLCLMFVAHYSALKQQIRQAREVRLVIEFWEVSSPGPGDVGRLMQAIHPLVGSLKVLSPSEVASMERSLEDGQQKTHDMAAYMDMTIDGLTNSVPEMTEAMQKDMAQLLRKIDEAGPTVLREPSSARSGGLPEGPAASDA